MSTHNIFLLGVNHDTAPIEIRERISFDPSSLSSAYTSLKGLTEVREALILSTCNRTELYVCCDDADVVLPWLVKIKNGSLEDVSPYIYTRCSVDVVTHAARVASGIDSMVIGETQILGQMKAAYRFSEAFQCLGRELRKVFDTAFSIAKDVRSNTAIGGHSVSMASSSLKVARRIFPDLSAQKVLFIGAGEMITLFCKHFSSTEFRSLTFSNRTAERALVLAKEYGGEVIEFDDVGHCLDQFDIVISCTGSSIPILGKGAFEESLRRRRRRPVLVIDLAVPRDIEASVTLLDDIFMFTVDDLGALVREGIGNRRAALNEANQIIQKRISDLSNLYFTDSLVDVVKLFRSFGDDLVKQEFEKAIAALRRQVDPEEVLRGLSTALGRKFLDRPSRVLFKTRGDSRYELGEALIKLFELDK